VFDLSGSVKSQADARIVTEVEVNRVDQRIEQSVIDDAFRQSLKSALHLGFYCGMRRGEVAQLRVGDVNGKQELWIFIRPWKNQKLKTRNSIRRSPATHLLPADSAQTIMELRDWRLRNGAGLNDPLWPSSDGTQHENPQNLIDAVVGLVQSTVGDSSLRFHHLRHSFATRLVLWHWHHANEGRIRFPGWFNTLREDGKRPTRPFLTGRNYLFPISEVMGHGSIDVTLTNYVHLLDVMLGLAMRQQVPDITRAFVEMLLNVGRSQAAAVKQDARHPWVGYESVLEASRRTRGRPPKAGQVERKDQSGPNARYWQAVSRQKMMGQPWPVANMIVDWPLIGDLYAGVDRSLVTLKSDAPAERVRTMGRFLDNLADHRVLLRSGVKASAAADRVPELSGDTLKGVQLWASRLSRVGMQRKTLVQAAVRYAESWVANTRMAVALDNLDDVRLMDRLLGGLLHEGHFLIHAHQPDPGSEWTIADQRAYWRTKGVTLAERTYRRQHCGTEAGKVVVDVDTRQWKRSQTTTLVGLRLLMVYMAMVGDQS